ncbi:MAG: dephospho-CoA kinase [Elusimicrobiota bacterium]|nr:MAG: dephospho-CoA kinase [Elusimicrobiota bacterium]
MKPKRLVVGLTGGIGSGKSTALAAFERLGAATISLDQLAKEQAKPGRDGYKAIVRKFGKGILNNDGTIDRAVLGKLVFSNPAKRRELEKATHPTILKEMKDLIGKMNGVVIVDVPLLFEKNLQKSFDACICISAMPRTQLTRIMRRDGLNEKDAKLRIKAQLSMAEKMKRSDVTISNDSDLKSLNDKVQSYYAGLDLICRGTN